MKKLPLGVGIIAVLVIIEAILQILAAFGLFGVSSLGFFVTAFGAGFALMAIGVMVLIIGLIELAVGIGLFNMEKWAWSIAVIVLWIDVVVDIIAAFVQAQSFGSVLLSMIIPVIVLMYLYQGGIKKKFA